MLSAGNQPNILSSFILIQGPILINFHILNPQWRTKGKNQSYLKNLSAPQ